MFINRNDIGEIIDIYRNIIKRFWKLQHASNRYGGRSFNLWIQLSYRVIFFLLVYRRYKTWNHKLI